MAPIESIIGGIYEAAFSAGQVGLTLAKARLATALAKGRSVRAAAQSNGITFATARSYLEAVFAKTATHRQGELVSLLKTVPQVGVA